MAEEGRVPVIRAATSLEAHDWCLCGDIQHGDVLLVESEGVVGIADAWPVAVTDVIGSFDYLGDALDQLPVGEVGFNMPQPMHPCTHQILLDARFHNLPPSTYIASTSLRICQAY